jgi:hypothetical protein
MRFGVRAAIITLSSLALLAGCGEKPEAVKPAEAPPAPVAAPEPAPALPAEPLLAGSQEARDDLYCSGLIYAVHKASPHDSLSAAADTRRLNAIALAASGVARLKAERVATNAAAAIADAHSEQASKDLDASALRIPYETCVARADALPKATQ